MFRLPAPLLHRLVVALAVVPLGLAGASTVAAAAPMAPGIV